MKDYDDLTHLLNNQYATADNIQYRKRFHAEYSETEKDFHQWLFNKLTIFDTDRILDIGCGSGDIWKKNISRLSPSVKFVLGDISRGMIEDDVRIDTEAQFSFVQCKAGSLPFFADRFDIVTAFHMLYHVPDIDTALAEFRRVLQDDGTLYVTTKGESHLTELYTILNDVLDEPPTYPKHYGFSLENGVRYLADNFDDVQCVTFDDRLVVTQVEPVIEFFKSGMYFDPSKEASLRERLTSELETGPLEIQKDTGLLIAHVND